MKYIGVNSIEIQLFSSTRLCKCTGSAPAYYIYNKLWDINPSANINGIVISFKIPGLYLWRN